MTVSRPVAPADYEWPTSNGTWAFEVLVPVSIAIEQQTWMEHRTMAAMWLPASPPGMCKQCALGERVCIQTRNRLDVGEPPRRPRRRASAHGAHGARTSPVPTSTDGEESDGSMPPPTPEPLLDYRCFV